MSDPDSYVKKSLALPRAGLRRAYDPLRLDSNTISYSWMLSCAFSTTLPLIFGLWRGEEKYAIFGSLFGYFISLNDQGGRRFERLWVAIISAIILYSTLALGLALNESPMIFALLVGALSYFTGLLSGRGGEVERLLLFIVIQCFIARYAFPFTPAIVSQIFIYAALGLLAAIACMLPDLLGAASITRPSVIRLREVWKIMNQSDLPRHGYALLFAGAILFATAYIEYYHVNRGYWTAVTVVLVLRPDQGESYRRIWQRVFGTFSGLILGEALVRMELPGWLLILAVFACNGLVPYAWQRNYWLVTFLATNYVLLLLDYAVAGPLEVAITRIRLVATLQGCAIGVLALVLSYVLTRATARVRTIKRA